MSSLRRPSLEALRVLESVVRLGSQRLAASELHITESAVSRRMGTLQQQLGGPLFRRTQRGLRATATARALAAAMQRSLTEIDAVLASVAATHPVAAPSTRLRIATSPGIANCWLGGRLARFCRAAPEVEPEVEVTEQGARELQSARADIAVHWGETTPAGLQADLLMAITEFPVCAPALLERGPPLARPSELAGHRLLHWVSRRFWADWLRKLGVRGVNARRGPVLHDYALCMNLAVSGEGVVLGDELLAGDRLLSGELVKPLAASRVHPRRMFLLTRPEQSRSVAMTRFVDWMHAEIDAHLELTACLREAAPYDARAVFRRAGSRRPRRAGAA